MERHAAIVNDVPTIHWIWTGDEISQQELEHRGATYHFGNNDIVVNGTYFAIVQLVDLLEEEYNAPSRQMVVGVVKEVIDEFLAWHIFQQRRKLTARGWNVATLEEATTKTALTAVLDSLSGTCLFQARKRLGHAMGKVEDDVFDHFEIEETENVGQSKA